MRDYNLEKIKKIMASPIGELIFKAQKVHKRNFKQKDIQLASLISIKTGSCPEDCKYCPQSAHYNVDLKKEKLINLLSLENAAIKAKKMEHTDFVWGQHGKS